MSDYFVALLGVLGWTTVMTLAIRSTTSTDAQRPMVARNTIMDTRGARRGVVLTGYETAWIEQQPSFATWKEESDRAAGREVFTRLALWMVIIVVGHLWYNRSSLSSATLAGICVFAPILVFIPMLIILPMAHFKENKRRQDNGPVPIPVRRRAFIEHLDGQYFFGIESQIGSGPLVLEVFRPWAQTAKFSSADYWRTFGDTGRAPVEGGWNAVIMAPSLGQPWLISSTIESDSLVYERVSLLNALFGDAAREKFFRGVKAKDEIQSESPQGGTGSGCEAANPMVNNGIPQDL